ncbi:TIGR02147 family protein [Fibrobacter sp. UWB16]|uniref:TIGR02147 family protein n=1 Tax=Fibrobacter sp. UWB16 TaxID=1945874 RepID=UPI000BC610BF|nr:TIGR02147 family protein [Fibrobacter sp. UWB16]SOD15822.1 TIGR02147 family protein [Fibrobacter sp. UWB16]
MFAKNKINIYDYSDYRKFLQEFYELEKSLDSSFSYRVFAAAVGMDASLLLKILQGKRHISPKCIDVFVNFFHFKDAKAEYFREMIAYGKAKNDEDVRSHFETLQKMRPAACRELDEARYRYFQQWYYPMIRSALDVFNYRGTQDAAALGECCIPKLSASQVKNAVDALLQLGLAHARNDGRVVPTEAHLKTMEHWLSACISDYQSSIAELAGKSIQNTPKEKRDISTLTMALDSRQIDKIREILAKTRKAIVNVVNAMPPQICDSVYQLNFQLFPMMKKEEQ